MPYDPRPDFDLSQLSDQEWIEYFFDRPVRERLFWDEIEGYCNWRDFAKPEVIVRRLQQICLEHAALVKAYSSEQIDQGLWAIFATFNCTRTLFDATVDVKLRISCIESMYVVYSDVVARMTGDVKSTFYWMWWDYIGHEDEDWEFGKLGLAQPDGDRMRVSDVIVGTLLKILSLPDRGCQWAALHGLRHMDHHPEARKIVQRYLDARGFELTDEDREWAEG